MLWAGAYRSHWLSRRPASASSSAEPANAVRAADVTVEDLDGHEISTRAWRGKVTIVNFWATWCPPCRTEIPDLVALQDRYRDQLQIVGISVDRGSVEQVRQFVREYRINYPVVMENPRLTNVFPRFAGLPASFILDRDSKIVQQYLGRMSRATYELEIRRLAGLPIKATVELTSGERRSFALLRPDRRSDRSRGSPRRGLEGVHRG